MFNFPKTSSITKDGPTKVLLYAHHGYGKTYQCRFYQKRFGKGLIISGESGLKSVEDVDIDYVPFSSWDGSHDPEDGVYSYRGICKMIASDEFKSAGYKWIAIDSLTELAERLIEHLEVEHKHNNNGFQLWADYSRMMIGTLKWIRDLDMHVYVTCLAAEEVDANDTTQYWPFVKGQKVAKQIPALFDHVLCGVRTTEKNENGMPKVSRYVVTDEASGWHGKVRDPRNRLKPYEKVDDVTELLTRMSMPDDEWEKYQSAQSDKTKGDEK
ncbi:MAG: hypothetical protein EBV86_00805 [Marivivens sp.]|nr:hypothetical protein [Marivivens sp.]